MRYIYTTILRLNSIFRSFIIIVIVCSVFSLFCEDLLPNIC